MSNPQRRPGKTRSAQLPLLNCGHDTNWTGWSKHLKHVNTVNGICNDEFRTETAHVNIKPMRTLTVPDDHVDAHGNIVPGTRAWHPVRDLSKLNTDLGVWDKKEEASKMSRRAGWSLIHSGLSSSVLNAVEGEPGYAEAEASCNSLALYMMCKTVCCRDILGNTGNTGNCRKKWFRHVYYPDDDVHLWANTNEDLMTDIFLASGNNDALSDNEKVQHLVDSFPSEIIDKAFPEVHRYKQSDPAYPTYLWCKTRIIQTVSRIATDA
jgi:hypothetical protein